GDLGQLHLGAHGRGGGADVDDGGPVLLDEGAEIGERAGGGLNGGGLGLGAGNGGEPAALVPQRHGGAYDQHQDEFLLGHGGSFRVVFGNASWATPSWLTMLTSAPFLSSSSTIFESPRAAAYMSGV